MRKSYLIGFAVVVTTLCFDLRSEAATTACENLTTLSLPNTTVTLAQLVPAGAFTPPAPAGRAGAGRAGAGPRGGAPDGGAPGAGAAGGGGGGRGGGGAGHRAP